MFAPLECSCAVNVLIATFSVLATIASPLTCKKKRFMAGTELRELPMARSFKLDEVVFCLQGLIKVLHRKAKSVATTGKSSKAPAQSCVPS